jgi:hypothetical protein
MCRKELWASLLAIVSLICVWGGARIARQVKPANAHIAATIAGAFPLNGAYPGEPLRCSAALRTWGSWAGSDTSQGTLIVGPFAAPTTLKLAVSGYPQHPGNSLYIERIDTRERVAITSMDVRERWQIINVDLPESWHGHEIHLVAIDHSSDVGGWLGVSEPIRSGFRFENAVLFEALAAWAFTGALLALIFAAALDTVTRYNLAVGYWTPLVSCGVVAIAAYGVFWAYFFGPYLGRAVSALIFASAAAIIIGRRNTKWVPGSESIRLTTALLVIGAFYVCLLHLFPTTLGEYDLARNRFRPDLPGDNGLPDLFATQLYRGQSLREVSSAGWLMSDRPPLEVGWELLTWWPMQVLGLDSQVTSNASGMWLQLSWVLAVYGLFRMLGISERRAIAWISVLAVSGFFVQNTTFIWPKLSGGAFACGALGLWAFPNRTTQRPTRFMIGGALAGLAWISHGGVAFSFIALAPWIAWRAWRGGGRNWSMALLAFLVFAVPWFAFQKLYNPPGDRLLKMHLAGRPEVDPRPFSLVIREAYAAKSMSDLVAARISQLRTQVSGDFKSIFQFTFTDAASRRDHEFFIVGRALTWWIVGLAALPIVVVRRELRLRLLANARAHTLLAAWTIGTSIVWCLLMFQPYSTVVHQGSYATMLTAFVLLSAWIDLTTPWLIWVIGALQTASFVTTWACSNGEVHGEPRGWPFVALTAAGLGALFFCSIANRRSNENALASAT